MRVLYFSLVWLEPPFNLFADTHRTRSESHTHTNTHMCTGACSIVRRICLKTTPQRRRWLLPNSGTFAYVSHPPFHPPPSTTRVGIPETIECVCVCGVVSDNTCRQSAGRKTKNRRSAFYSQLINRLALNRPASDSNASEEPRWIAYVATYRVYDMLATSTE